MHEQTRTSTHGKACVHRYVAHGNLQIYTLACTVANHILSSRIRVHPPKHIHVYTHRHRDGNKDRDRGRDREAETHQ